MLWRLNGAIYPELSEKTTKIKLTLVADYRIIPPSNQPRLLEKKMKTYKAYKVLYERADGKLFSCCRNEYFPIEFIVEYEVGKIVKPSIPESKLFAFLDLEDAKSFMNNLLSKMVIYECEGVGLSTSAVPQSFDYYESDKKNLKRDFIRYWKNFTQAKNSKKAIPRGNALRFPYLSSVAFDSIKLTKLVEHDH